MVRALPLAALAASPLGTGICWGGLEDSDENPVIVGEGPVKTDSRTLEKFHSVVVTGSLEVKWSRGDHVSTVVSAQENVLAHIRTVVRDGKLKIYSDANIQTDEPVTVTLSAPVLDDVGVVGSGNFSAADVGGAKIKAAVEGSGQVTLAGQAGELSVVITGSGSLAAVDLKARRADVTVIGSGHATVYASDELNGTVLGSGSVSYLGDPKEVSRHLVGSGEIAARSP